MPTRPALLAALLLAPATAHAQRTELYADLGATWAAPLVTDDALGTSSEIRQAIAPTIRGGVSFPFTAKLRAGAEVAFATGSVSSEVDGATIDLPGVSTLALQATLGGPLVDRLRWRAAVGALKYFPSEETGIWQQGGPFRPLVGLGLEYRLPLSSSLDVRLHGRADTHPFTTDELGRRGFGGSQWVPRVALGVGIARGGA
jgi:hypothetical protein